jgi:hypothetical protein
LREIVVVCVRNLANATPASNGATCANNLAGVGYLARYVTILCVLRESPEPEQPAAVERRQLNVRLPGDLFEAVEYVATSRGVSTASLVATLVTEWVAVHMREVEDAILGQAERASSLAERIGHTAAPRAC